MTLRVPMIRPRAWCNHRGPKYRCNRPIGHTGRHCYSWQRLDGRVREVWG